MNDWEIVGTQNRWVCPNDRHLQLRAHNQCQKNVITDSEKKHITAVLAKAEDRRLREKQRIGRMIDRLEKLKSRATGNGITQCYLCSTDFGLLSSRSYAAMCSECRKYVCQKNCGVEAYDFVRRENIFLCKICSEYREMWKKSGAWFYNEIPEYIKPDENSESHSPSSYYPRNSWQHYTKSETSNLAYSSNKSQQSQKEQCKLSGSMSIWSNKPIMVTSKVRLSLSNGYTSEDENADNSASDDMEILSKKNLQLTSSIAATNRRNRIQKRIEEQDIPIIHRFTIGTRNRTTNNEDNESHHATSSTSPRHSASLYGDDLSQNQSSILASESIDSGVVPSDHSIRISNIPASADAMNPSLTMIAHVDESNKFLNYSNYPQTLKASTRIQKTILSSEIPSLQSHDGKSSLSMQQESKNSKEISENNDILLEKIFPLMILANEQSSSVAFPQYNQEEQLLTFSPSYTASPSSPVGTIITPTDSSKKQAPNHESTVSSASSTSSIRKSMVSLESLPANLEKLKKETSTFGKFTLDGRRSKGTNFAEKIKRINAITKKGLSSTQSAICLQSSIATESFPTDQSVRHAISGNDINNLQNFDIDKCGSIQFTLRYSAQQMKLHIRLTSAKNLRAMDKNRLLVLDRDRIGSDFLGEVHVPLKDLKNDEETFYNLHLKQAILAKDINPSNERGKICLSLLYNVQQGSLYVTIKRCAELLGMDKTGFSDPYVKVSLLPLTNKAHRKKTSTKKGH
ncbi:Double C2-like domain-containing protein beta [Dirofilaria immitis]|nr:Double C2-like domain-containing protein beta [Dirofilaria immitis]